MADSSPRHGSLVMALGYSSWARRGGVSPNDDEARRRRLRTMLRIA